MDPFLGEIRIFAGSFAPRNWATCDGQTIQVAQSPALFSLLGVNFGGNGTSNFKLPDFRGRAPMHTTQYASSPIGSFPIGAAAGSPTVTLDSTTMAGHTHTMMARATTGNVTVATSMSSMAKTDPSTNQAYQTTASPLVPLSPNAVFPTGGNGAHNNMQPYLALTFIIALQGLFPQRQ